MTHTRSASNAKHMDSMADNDTVQPSFPGIGPLSHHTSFVTMRPINPCTKPRPAAAVAAADSDVDEGDQGSNKDDFNMGRQSQQRLNNTKKAHRLRARGKKRKSGQLALQGKKAFDAAQDCIVCHARHVRDTMLSTHRAPNRAHHVLCVRNKNAQGRGPTTKQNMANTVEEKRLKTLHTDPLANAEKCSGRFATVNAANKFFTPTQKAQQPAAIISPTTATTTPKQVVVTPFVFGKTVSNSMEDSSFLEAHKNKSAPLAMTAFAAAAMKNIVKPKLFEKNFNGLTMTAPRCDVAFNDPQCNSIVGQRLLHVDWTRVFGVEVPCPDGNCNGILKNVRHNHSKNKTLFPTFDMNGAPAWCIVQKMECLSCRRDFQSNEAPVLLTLPPHLAQLHPVEPKHALSNHSCHLEKNATNVLDTVMLTHANGELFSRLLCNTINKDHLERITGCCSHKKSDRAADEPVKECIEKDGGFLKQFPPTGDTIRDMCDEASGSSNNPWGTSDAERHTREMQGVQCHGGIFAQDHTFSVINNYQKKKLGAKAVWDVATNTGEIAAAVCVPAMQTIHFSHAARQLTDRPHFNPAAMHSDTWPHKKEHWEKLIPGLKGRLGLFHCEQRVISTLRKNHIDFYDALPDLLDALCEYEATDYENLLSALKGGTLSSKGNKLTTEEITDLKRTKHFRKRHGKHLRKRLREPNTMVQRLDDWFCKHKVTSSDPDARPARERLDPGRNIPLFTSDTKSAAENCKLKASHLADPMQIDHMCDKIQPNPNSKHQLIEHMSKRGESKLESFHDRLAHFANGGMRDSLSDNLHLAGTARHNLAIRHKRHLMTLEKAKRYDIPAAWEKIVPFWNHTELVHINQMAIKVGCHCWL